MEALKLRATTVLGVRHKGKCAMGADGQVGMGDTVMKHRARKVRRIYNNSVLAGFAGGAADGSTLLERFESKLEEFSGNIQRAVVELSRDWRSDRTLRRLDALLVVMDPDHSYIVSGDGDLIEPDDGVVAIGSGGAYALAASRAYLDVSDLSASSIVERSLKVAASICIYTNDNIIIEKL